MNSMVGPIHVEVLLVAGYALFLLVSALGLERMARHTHRRAARFETGGFVYLQQLDRYACPSGQHLWRTTVDHGRRLAIYRAPAHICNACPLKGHCTDSDEGRMITHALDPWLATQIGRFHRGLSLALLLLAGLFGGVVVLRHHAPLELVLLGGVLGPVGVVALRLLTAFLEQAVPGAGPPDAR